MSLVFIILVALLALNVLILVHELGHFIVGKRRGMKIEIFSIGMGPKVFGVKRGETEYRLSWFLFGGYVKFVGDEVEEDKEPVKTPGSFYGTSPLSRILVCAAGGFCNIVFAGVLYTVISFNGMPVPEHTQQAIVGKILEDSTAQEMGLKPGDRLVEINGQKIDKWEDIITAVAFSNKDDVIVTIERDNGLISKTTMLKVNPKLGIRMLGVMSREFVLVGDVMPDSPAQKAGLLKGDEIVGVNGEEVFMVMQLVETIRENLGKEVKIDIIREGKEHEILVVPEVLAGNEYPAIGFVPTYKYTTIYPSPWYQFKRDIVRLGKTLRGLFTRRIPVKALAGPVGIIGIIGMSAQLGWSPFLAIVALISLNLGIVNLLPIPVLDGGHILFTLIEAIRKKPVSFKVITRIQNAFVYLLIALALYVSYNDILRFFNK